MLVFGHGDVNCFFFSFFFYEHPCFEVKPAGALEQILKLLQVVVSNNNDNNNNNLYSY